jgi:hypothetical protein
MPANPLLRSMAHVISFLFHPLFINAYVMGFLIFVHPYAFAGFDDKLKVFRFANIVLCNTFLPAFAIFLMWRLQLIHSIYLRTQRERIIPYLAAMIFYFWTWLVFYRMPEYPAIPIVAIHFLLGSFLAVCGGWIFNIYFKISMHGIAIGGALMFFFLLGFYDNSGSGLYILLALLAAGLVCSSRLILSVHSPFEVWAGLFVGMITQYIAWKF